MKNLFFTTILLMTMCYLSQSQSIPTIPPCYTDFTDQNPPQDCNVPWSGPYWIVLTSNDYYHDALNCNNPPPPLCNFELEFYYRIVDCPPSNYFFDLQIVAVKTTPESCWDCLKNNKDKIIKELYWRKFEENKNSFQMFWGQCNYTSHIVTLGACYNNSTGFPCSDPYCCASWTKVCFDSQGNIISVDPWPTPQDRRLYPLGGPDFADCAQSPANCPTGLIKCDINLVNPVCDIICNSGEWLQASPKTIPFGASCPTCSLTIHYKYRDNENCDPPYKDYSIDYIEPSLECANCMDFDWQDGSFYYTSLEYLLLYGELGVPSSGCEDYYRSISSPCWKEIYSPTWRLDRCQSNQCCWSHYRVCSNGTKTLLEQSSYLQNCPIENNIQCRVICGDFPYKKPEINKNNSQNQSSNFDVCETYYSASSNSTNFTIHLKSSYVGLIKLILYNYYGDALIIKELNKADNECIIDLDVSALPIGAYYYEFYVNDYSICKGKAIINR
jgi:hypothetical protein